MKRFLLHLTGFTLLAAGMFAMLTRYTDQKLQARTTGRMQVWHNIAHGSINADMLILGSSHAHVQVNSNILAKAFNGWRVYNLGIDGYNFDMQLAQYRFYRKHNKAPRLLLLCIDYFEFAKSRWEMDRAQFLPYMYDSDIANGLTRIGLNPIARSVPFLKYKGQANAVMAALTGASPLPQDNDNVSNSGYLPRNFRWNESDYLNIVRNGIESRPELNKEVWNSFLDFLGECNREGVAVCLVFTPHEARFTQYVQGGGVYRRQIAYATDDKAPFFDFTNSTICNDTSLFYGTTHLNSKGADVFTTTLVDSLRKVYGTGLEELPK